MNIRVNKIFILACILFSFLSCEYHPYSQGKRLYKVHCENCHAEDGSGLVKLIPPVSKVKYIEDNLDNLSCIIKNGISDTLIINGIEYSTPMEGISSLTETEIANIINFMIYEFDYGTTYYSEAQIKEQLSLCN